MIAKVGRRGSSSAGVLRYLFGRGRANEHTDLHLVAASDPEWLPGGALAPLLTGRGGLARLGREVDAAMTGHDVAAPGGHIYHVVLAIPADNGRLGDALWREHLEQAVAKLDFGADPRGRGGSRWVAVHHGTSTAGNDHVHLVLNLVRGDGRIASTYRDWPRWRQWCREVEGRGQLTPTSPAGAGQRATSRAELDRAHRRGQDTDRARLRRRVQQALAPRLSWPP